MLGTSETVAGLDRQRILDYLHSAYQPDSMVVAAVGNLEHQAFVDLVGGSPVRTSARLQEGNGRKPPKPSSGVHIKPRDLEQVHVAMGATRAFGHP